MRPSLGAHLLSLFLPSPSTRQPVLGTSVHGSAAGSTAGLFTRRRYPASVLRPRLAIFSSNRPAGAPTRRSRRLAHLPPSDYHQGPTAHQSDGVVADETNGRGMESSPFRMHIVLRPRPATRPNVAMNPPFVIAVNAPTAASERELYGRGVGDVTGVWVFVSLVTGDGTQTLAPPRDDLLLGRRADSIHPVFEEPGPEEVTVGYAVFSDLSISEPGSFCLRASLIDMDRSVHPEGLPSSHHQQH